MPKKYIHKTTGRVSVKHDKIIKWDFKEWKKLICPKCNIELISQEEYDDNAIRIKWLKLE